MEFAKKLVAEGRRADVIHANNVLAHVADTNGFVKGIATLLKDDGVAVIECPYVKDLIEHGEFDTIYHEHLCYFSVTALQALFGRHGLYVTRVVPLSIHGGSLRVFVEKQNRPEQSVTDHLESERRLGLDRLDYYADFSNRVNRIRTELNELLQGLKERKARIVGYGAAAKGTIMLNYVGIGQETLDFVVDRNTHKQGRFIPGVRLPIASPERVLAEQPDYLLILPWNFKDEIMAQQAEYPPSWREIHRPRTASDHHLRREAECPSFDSGGRSRLPELLIPTPRRRCRARPAAVTRWNRFTS